MPEQWFRVVKCGVPSIKRVEVLRSTADSVWVRAASPTNYLTKRRARSSQFEEYFPSLTDAITCGRRVVVDAKNHAKWLYEKALEDEAAYESRVALGEVIR